MNGKITLSNKLKGAVTMANTIINGGASPYPKGASGDIITITDGADNTPLKSCVVNIEPVQDLHGYSYPWPAGGGVNKYPILIGEDTFANNASGTHSNDNGTLVVTGTTAPSSGVYSSGTSQLATKLIELTGTVTYSFYIKANIAARVLVGYEGAGDGYVNATTDWQRVSFTTTVPSSKKLFTVYATGTAATFYVKDFQIESGSSASPYAPYENLCPISGWTQVNVWVKPTYDTSLTPTATTPLGRTVYGGTLDVVKGKLNAKPYYASYSGQALVGPWISSHDKYVAGATPTTGAQVVDMGAAGTEYDVTPQTIKTLLGTNNIWADAGEMSIEYYPAAASIVAVQNRSTKMYVSIPLGMIRYETYQITPQQTIDLDSYRSENGNLLRNPVATKCKLEFNTPLMTDTQWGEIWNIIKAGFNNNTERKLKLKYYDTLSASYKTGHFYVPDVQTTIRNIEEAEGVINYQEIRLAFIEY